MERTDDYTDDTTDERTLSAPERREIIPAVGELVTTVGRMRTSLSLLDNASKVALLNAMGPGEIEIPPSGIVQLSVRDYVTYPDVVTDEQTGEVRDVTRTVLITTDGRCLRSTSEHWRDRVLAMAALFSRADWDEGISVVIEAKVGRRKRVYHDLRLVNPL